MSSFKILVTKELSPASLIGFDQAGIEVIQVPFILVRPIESAEKKAEINKRLHHPEAVVAVFTSKYAVKYTMEQLAGDKVAGLSNWKIFCLDGLTKDYVTKLAGGDLIVDTALNAAKLAERIIQHNIYRHIHFFCGDKRREDLPQLLRDNGISVTEIQVYQTIPTPVNIQGRQDGVVFFSPSAVESFFSVNAIPADTVCFAIGTTTAAALREHTRNPVIISASPVEEELMQTVWSYIKKTKVINDQH